MSDNNEKKSEAMLKSKTRLQIKVSDEKAAGVYANVAIIHNNDAEFVFDFVFIEPQRQQGHVISRVVANPRTTKRMLFGLQELVRTYEERYGEIPVPEKNTPRGTYH